MDVDYNQHIYLIMLVKLHMNKQKKFLNVTPAAVEQILL